MSKSGPTDAESGPAAKELSLTGNSPPTREPLPSVVRVSGDGTTRWRPGGCVGAHHRSGPLNLCTEYVCCFNENQPYETEPFDGPLRAVVVPANTEVLDETALRLLYAQHAGPIMAYLVRLTRDHARAEDLLQETMLRAWRRPAAFEPGRGPVRGWLRTVARNLAVDDIRARSSRPSERELTEEATHSEPGEDPYDAAILAWEVADALSALSAQHREVLIEVYYRRSSVAEAAVTLGIAPGTVKSRTFYALRALRAACQERGIAP